MGIPTAIPAPLKSQPADSSERLERYRRALQNIEHATAPGDDDAHHENAYSLAVEALRGDWFCPYCNPCQHDGNEKCRWC